MNKQARRFLPIVILVGLLGVSGCKVAGTNDSNSKTSTPASDSNKVSILFWHTMGHSNQLLLQNMINRFEAVYPNITVNETAASGNYDDLQNLILTGAQAGSVPTMAFCYPDNVAAYLAKDMVADMASYTTDATVGFQKSDGSHLDSTGAEVYGAADYVKTFWDEGTSYTKAGTYSVPFAKSTEALFYNKTEFAKNGWSVPTTWDQMWDLCQQIRDSKPEKDSDGTYKYYPLGYDSDANLYITLSQQKNIPYTSATGDHYLFNNSQAKTMMTELKSKYDLGLFKTKGTTANSTYTSTKFTAGEIMMSIGSTGGTQYNDTSNFEVGVAVPPSVDVDKPAVISQGPSICFFKSATAAELKAAWLFYRFISTAENSTYYAVSTGYQPVRTSSFQTAQYQSFINAAGDDRGLFNEVASVTSKMNNSYFNSPVFVGSAKARVEMAGLVSSILLGTATTEAAFTSAMSNCLNG